MEIDSTSLHIQCFITMLASKCIIHYWNILGKSDGKLLWQHFIHIWQTQNSNSNYQTLESTKSRIILEIFNVRHVVIMHNIYDSKVTSLFSDLAHFFLLKTPQLFMHVWIEFDAISRLESIFKLSWMKLI